VIAARMKPTIQNSIGLASISMWSQSDHREYMAITCYHHDQACDQAQAWSRSFTLLVSVICLTD